MVQSHSAPPRVRFSMSTPLASLLLTLFVTLALHSDIGTVQNSLSCAQSSFNNGAYSYEVPLPPVTLTGKVSVWKLIIKPVCERNTGLLVRVCDARGVELSIVDSGQVIVALATPPDADAAQAYVTQFCSGARVSTEDPVVAMPLPM